MRRSDEHRESPAAETGTTGDASSPDERAEADRREEVRALTRAVIAEYGPLLQRLAE